MEEINASSYTKRTIKERNKVIISSNTLLKKSKPNFYSCIYRKIRWMKHKST